MRCQLQQRSCAAKHLRNVADILCSVDVSLQFLERSKGPRVVQWHQRAVALFHQICDRASILIQCWYVVQVAVSGCVVTVPLLTVEEQDFWVQKIQQDPQMNNSIKMEVGIEDCLHIEFEYNKTK